MRRVLARLLPAASLFPALSAVLLAPVFASSQEAVSAPPAAGAPAQPGPAPARPDCKGPMHRQFDFWAGDWDVRTPEGDLAGTNRIDPILAGCALLENWAGSKGGSGKSLNFYDSKSKKWNQVWIDEGGGVLRLEGGLSGASMILEGRQPDGSSIERITWTPLPDGRVRQLWESSKDGGKAWQVQFDGLYSRRSPQ